MKFFIKVVNGWKFFTIFAKTSILVVCWVLIATLAHHKISLMTSQTFVVISFVTLPSTPLILMVNVWLWEVFVVYDLFFICSSSQLCCFIGYAVVSSRYRPKCFLIVMMKSTCLSFELQVQFSYGIVLHLAFLRYWRRIQNGCRNLINICLPIESTLPCLIVRDGGLLVSGTCMIYYWILWIGRGWFLRHFLVLINWYGNVFSINWSFTHKFFCAADVRNINSSTILTLPQPRLLM